MAYLSYSTSFNGTTDYLSIPTNAAFSFGTGDFTAEMWIYPNGAQTDGACLISTRNSGFSTGTGAWELRFQGTNAVRTQVRPISSGDYSINAAGTTTITPSVWTHIALVRIGTTLTLYQGGVSIGSNTIGAGDVIGSGSFVLTMGFATGLPYFRGSISNVRIVKGTAVYTSAFTPPTLPLTAISGTSFLTCQSATTVDNSTNNFTITTTGTAVISNSNTPFNYTLSTKDIYARPTPRVNSVNKLTTETSSLLTTNMYQITGLTSKVITRPSSSVISVIKLTTETSSLLTTNMYSITGLSSKVITRPTLSITSVIRLTTETNSLVTTKMYSITGLSSKVITRPALSIFSVIRFSTFIKTSNDPIVDAATSATNQTWTIS